jgi:hypothetical protein
MKINWNNKDTSTFIIAILIALLTLELADDWGMNKTLVLIFLVIWARTLMDTVKFDKIFKK